MSDDYLRQQLVKLLTEGQAHQTFEEAVKDFPLDKINLRPARLEYSFWHLVEHLRICQWDILDYIRNSHYQMIEWPKDYWPAPDADTNEEGWQASIDLFLADRAELVKLILDPATDLYTPIPHGYDGHTILREILVVADHNAYHIGELGILRQQEGLW